MTQPVNIAIIAGQLVVGGAERQLYLWLSNLDRSRFNPVVITLHPGHTDYWEKPIEDLGIPLYRVYQSKNRLRRLLQIIKILHPHKPSLIHGWHMFSGAYAALAAKCLRAKSIAGIRSNFQAIRGSFETFLVRCLSNALVVNSQTAASLYQTEIKASRQKVFVVKNAIMPEFDQRSSSRSHLQQQHNLKSDAIWLASIGRMDPLKRFDLLLNACARLSEQGINYHLLLVGDGPEYPALHELAVSLGLLPNVTFTGEVPNASRWLPAFDIFCFPSLAEGAPNVVMEAAAAGLPVVAWDLPFNREVLPSVNKARLCHAEDVPALSDALLELIQSPNLRQSLGASAQEHVLANFSLSKYISHMTNVYDQVLGQDHL